MTKRNRSYFQFSLRFLLFLFVGSSVIFGIYMSMRPVQFVVPAVMPLDEQAGMRISEVTEHRAFWVANDVRRNAKREAFRARIAFGWPSAEGITPEIVSARKAFLLEDLERVYFEDERDQELIDEHAAEFLAAAKTQIGETKHFGRAASAAAILHRLEKKNQIAPILERYISRGKQSKDLYQLCICFSRKQIASEPEFLAALREQAINPANSSTNRVKFAELLPDADRKELENVHWSIARGFKFDNSTADSIAWLISDSEHDQHDQAFELALKFLHDPKLMGKFSSYKCVDLITAVVESEDYKNSTKLKSDFRSIFKKLSLEHRNCLETLVGHKGEELEEIFKTVVSSLDKKRYTDRVQYRIAFDGLCHACFPEDLKALLRRSLENSDHAHAIFHVAIQHLGTEESISIIRSRWEKEKHHWLLKMICEHTPVEEGSQLKSILEEGFRQSIWPKGGGRYIDRRQPFEVTSFMRKFGFNEEAKRCESQHPNIDEYILPNSTAAKQNVEWFNQHFELARPMIAAEVVATDSKSPWRMAESTGQFSVLDFKTAMFNAAGFGRVIDPEQWGTGGGLFAGIAELGGDEFHVEAYDVNESNDVRLLINDRVYEFNMSDDWSWYYSEPACDVLNAIAERQKLTKRFFVFKHAYANSYVRLVVFAEPEKVEGFVEHNSEFEVEAGCEKFWNVNND